MTFIGVKYVPDFHNEDVVLLSLGGAGLDAFLAALMQAERRGSSRPECGGRPPDFVIEAGAADIELTDDRVVWRLTPGKAVEIIEKLKVLSGGHPGHHYVDVLTAPAPTLDDELD